MDDDRKRELSRPAMEAARRLAELLAAEEPGALAVQLSIQLVVMKSLPIAAGGIQIRIIKDRPGVDPKAEVDKMFDDMKRRKKDGD